MRWLLAGCCAMALIGLSAALNHQVTQMPRFYGVKFNRNVGIYCSSKPPLPATVHWYKADTHDGDPKDRSEVKGARFQFHDRNQTKNSLLYIEKVKAQDNGLYFCKINDTWGSGTQVLAIKVTDVSQALQRTTIKDVLIIFQGLLLAAAVAILMLRRKMVSEKTDIIYEEPDTDHIYEGLAIERCDAGLYEELSVYAQTDGAEAPWE
ncbi:B-cell antigen receptor complex-associated protein beta chain [Paralichthys olivaceus]|uniref:B cell accessory protein n=1 Tax=Paralichthys olivaceus TaxID=8255 RepID=M9T141_PAROL|nr:PREDICTED: B-cell antigen receptor complex-associated protein beta chain [Paralichthys olivaceus]AGI96975.1 B cell accessory protein [Paralichthys olivaceus]